MESAWRKSGLLALVVALCSGFERSPAQESVAPMEYGSVSVHVEIPREAKLVESGVSGFTLYDLSAGILFEPSSIWSSGAERDPVVGLEPEKFRRVVSVLREATTGFPSTPTHSGRVSTAPHNPALGVDRLEWIRTRRNPPGSVNLSFSGVEGDYDRSLEVVIPPLHIGGDGWDVVSSLYVI